MSRRSALSRKRMDVPRHIAAAIVLLAAMICISGCTRAYYRKQADAEVNCIIDHKAVAVGSAPGEFRIDVDPRSRMYDPNDPDCPPMPPDDPISHQLMNCVDCKPGAPCWQHAPHTPYVDNPTWEDYLPRDDEGQVVLDLPGAVQTGAAAIDRLPAATRNAVSFRPGRDVRAVPLRHAVLRRVVDLLHGRRARPSGPAIRRVGSSVLERQSRRRAPATGCGPRSSRPPAASWSSGWPIR